MKVQVRYFELGQEDGFELGDFDVSELDELVRLVKRFGVQAYNKKGQVALEAGSDTYLDSQFFIGEQGKFFEIIVG